jgi:hypothetical protein
MQILMEQRGCRRLFPNLKPTAIQFPIFTTDIGFHNRQQGWKQWAGLDCADLEAIMALQPYQGSDPNADPLFLLHTINNIDKHRTLHIGRHYITTSTTGFGVRAGKSVHIQEFEMFRGRMNENDIMASLTVGRGSSIFDTKIEVGSTCHVQFGEASEAAFKLPVLETLQSIKRHVDENVFREDGLLKGL